MKSYKLHKKSGAIEIINAIDFTQAERIAYGRRGGWADPVMGISLIDSIEETKAARLHAIALYKSLETHKTIVLARPK